MVLSRDRSWMHPGPLLCNPSGAAGLASTHYHPSTNTRTYTYVQDLSIRKQTTLEKIFSRLEGRSNRASPPPSVRWHYYHPSVLNSGLWEGGDCAAKMPGL